MRQTKYKPGYGYVTQYGHGFWQDAGKELVSTVGKRVVGAIGDKIGRKIAEKIVPKERVGPARGSQTREQVLKDLELLQNSGRIPEHIKKKLYGKN